MRSVIFSLGYVARDILGVLFAIQFLLLALKGKAWFVSARKIGPPRFSSITAKSMKEKYFWAAVVAAVFAGVIWDLHRKFPR
jgi:glycerol uptake facilitator-like aquaporin